MWITQLAINDLRVIEQMKLIPGRGLNLIVGDNGAGKTSVLEAIYLAGRGRTFRHPEAGPMIRGGAASTMVVIELEHGDGEKRSILGVKRERRDFVCRLNGLDIKKRSVLAETLPVQWIGSQPQQLLAMGPDVRRRFLDMGMFHVEHCYLGVMAEFQRALKQRNAAIRQGMQDAVRLWVKPLATAASSLSRIRETFAANLLTRTAEIIRQWDVGFDVDYRYRRGWSGGEDSLREQLERKTELDLRMGFTTIGPQRAELEVLSHGALAEKKLSRGQQKILVVALNLALMDLVIAKTGNAPVLLLDDLGAELDRHNRQRILSEIHRRECQAFVTLIDSNLLEPPADEAATMFHVKHGALFSPAAPSE